MDGKNVVSLVQASQLLKVSYQVCRDRLFRGELRGWQDANGRWWIERTSVTKAQLASRARREPVPA